MKRRLLAISSVALLLAAGSCFVLRRKSIEVPEGANLRKEALKAGIDVYAGLDKVLHCPGLGMCTTCKVRIVKGKENVSPPGRWEKMKKLRGEEE